MTAELATDQCSICLDSPPYSECPGRQCCALIIDNKTVAKVGISESRDQIETPRTDAVSASQAHRDYHYRWHAFADLCRMLERELAAALKATDQSGK